MSSIVSISSGTPIEPRAIAQKMKANSTREAVLEVGQRMAAFDQMDGVDLDGSAGAVDVSDARLPSKGLANSLISSIVPEKVTGFANYDEQGQLQSLYTSSQDIGGTKELQFQRLPDGSQAFAVSTPTGQTTVRQNADGTLFMMESPKPSSEDWAALTATSFEAPVVDPQQQPLTVADAKNSYIENAKRQRELVEGLFDSSKREESFKGLVKDLFRLNPFRR